MATWIKCTRSDGAPAFVNFDLVTVVVDSDEGTKVFFAGSPDDECLIVSESAEDLISVAEPME